MTSARLRHSIEAMQKVYLHLFDNIQNEIVELINLKELHDQKQDQKQGQKKQKPLKFNG